MKEKHDIELWLVWKDPNTRQRFVVGRLWYDGKYRFQYFKSNSLNNINNCGVDLAERFGFTKLEPFRDAYVYSNDVLFQIFNKRLPDRTRIDFSDIVKEYNLSPDCTPLELLEATGGRLAIDTLEFVTPFSCQESGEFEISFFIAGWRHYNGELVLTKLYEGTTLKLALEPTNEYDPFAIKILGPGDVMLGYVPVYYSRYLDEAVKNNTYQAHIERLGPIDNPQIRVLVKIKGVVSSLANVVKQIDQRIKSLTATS